MDQENNTNLEIRKNTYKSYLGRNKSESARIQGHQTARSAGNETANQSISMSAPRESLPENPRDNSEDLHNQEPRIKTNQNQNQQVASAVGNVSKQRIDWVTAILMIWLALFYDGIQFLLNFIPVIGNLLSAMVIGLWAWLSFYIWFKIKGVSFSKPRRSITLFGAGILEMIPLLNVLPAWTIAVLALIATTKAEDALGFKIPTKKIPG